METILTYNIKVTCDVKANYIKYIKQQINSKQLTYIYNNQLIYIYTYIYIYMYIYIYIHIYIFVYTYKKHICYVRKILTICLIYKCYGKISKKTTPTFAFKMLKQKYLHTCFITCIFPIIAFVTVSSKSECISGFPYILLATTLTCEEISQTVTITVECMIYLETFACCSARKCGSFLNI